MKIVTVLGARPQFIKASVLSREMAKHPNINECIVHTGQHFDENMSGIFFHEMGIRKPDYNLGINALTHGAMTGRMLEEIEGILQKERPDWVLVFGDTNSTLAGALAAKKLGIKVAHVESGLRSFNMDMPEEINRILTDNVSDLLFCPTDIAVENLVVEGFNGKKGRIIKTGDVMYDSIIHYGEMAREKSSIMETLGLTQKGYVLATVHREGNVDDPLRLNNIFKAFGDINESKPVILLAHPRTKGILEELNIEWKFKIVEAVGYFDMLQLLTHCELVLTDSGGLQKEAFWMKKPCVTLREETEWLELVSNGYNILAGAQTNSIMEAFNTMVGKRLIFEDNFYGNGNASQTIVSSILSS